MRRISATVLAGLGNYAILIALCLLSTGIQVRAAELEVLTEEYPPITFTRDGKVTGLGTEIVEEIQRRVGSTSRIGVVPWARAYQAALSQANVALFTTMRTPEREALFRWVGPLTTVKAGLYARRGSGLRLETLGEAKAVHRIVVPREYWTHQILRAAGFSNLDTADTPERMVRMLLAGRASLMAADNQTLPEILAQVGASTKDVELIHTFSTSQSYVVLSLGTPEDTARRWQRALNDMKRDGSFARIYAKWLPGEVPPGLEPNPDAGPVKR